MCAKRLVFDNDRLGPWISERTGGTYHGGAATIGLENSDGTIAGGVLFDQYTGRSICIHVAGTSVNWITREFLRVCFDYPFNQLGVIKLIGLVDSTNLQARSFDENVGFTLETTIKDASKYGDLLIYSMTRQQCRFLKKVGKENGQTVGTSSS